jgi:outer membrane translocation and assembly module TamA
VLQGEIVQHVPILRENWVISLRGRLESVLDDDDQVPYFLLPSLGSGSTLRGYSSWRFRDRHSLLMSAEWRWIPSRLAMDMAIFYDTGKVTPRFDDISFKDLKSDYGIGVRFHTPFATPLRVELARSREGTRIVFSGGAAF